MRLMIGSSSRAWLVHFTRVDTRLVVCLVFIWILPLIGLRASTVQVPEKIGPRNKTEPWIQYEINNITYEVALEWPMGNESGLNNKRVLFVYLEPRYFNKDTLLLVFGNISSKIPQPTVLNVTLLTNRDILKNRVQNYSGWIMSNETPYTRLTVESDTCCLPHFSGAQFDRYPDSAKFVICSDGKQTEMTVDYKPR